MISIDHREAASGIIECFKEHDVEHEIKQLKYGDYVIDNAIAFERKTAEDFIVSIMDGRIFRQSINLVKHYIYACLIIEGNPFKTGHRMHKNAIEGALIELMIFLSIPVMFTNSTKETLDRILTVKKHSSQLRDRRTERPGYKPKRIYNRQLYILQGLPMIGRKKSMRLLNHFGTLKNVFNADEKQLTQVRGINTKISGKIIGIINKKF